MIVKPAHGERISLEKKGCLEQTYLIEGYALSGGGDRVERVELSLDGGKTWKYCFRRFTDSPLRSVPFSYVGGRPISMRYRHGEKYWAWIFW